MNIIADIAGEFDALMRLVKRMPKEETIYLLGDLNDRGPRSKEVIQWAMDSEPHVVTLQSNHGHMFVDFWLTYMDADHDPIYHPHDFIQNGGFTTLESYGALRTEKLYEMAGRVDPKHIYWLKSRPHIVELEDIIMSHAMMDSWSQTVEDAVALVESNPFHGTLWNRQEPKKRDKFQVCGHNSHWGLRWFGGEPKDAWAVCLDASQSKQLTGMHWPSREIFQEPYVLPEK